MGYMHGSSSSSGSANSSHPLFVLVDFLLNRGAQAAQAAQTVQTVRINNSFVGLESQTGYMAQMAQVVQAAQAAQTGRRQAQSANPNTMCWGGAFDVLAA